MWKADPATGKIAPGLYSGSCVLQVVSSPARAVVPAVPYKGLPIYIFYIIPNATWVSFTN